LVSTTPKTQAVVVKKQIRARSPVGAGFNQSGEILFPWRRREKKKRGRKCHSRQAGRIGVKILQGSLNMGEQLTGFRGSTVQLSGGILIEQRGRKSLNKPEPKSLREECKISLQFIKLTLNVKQKFGCNYLNIRIFC